LWSCRYSDKIYDRDPSIAADRAQALFDALHARNAPKETQPWSPPSSAPATAARKESWTPPTTTCGGRCRCPCHGAWRCGHPNAGGRIPPPGEPMHEVWRRYVARFDCPACTRAAREARR
jgi:hypothetical protein